jgi:hypothetical protein
MSSETKHTKDIMRADFIATDGSWVDLWDMKQQRISSLEAQLLSLNAGKTCLCEPQGEMCIACNYSIMLTAYSELEAQLSQRDNTVTLSDGLVVGENMVVAYRDRIAELEAQLADAELRAKHCNEDMMRYFNDKQTLEAQNKELRDWLTYARTWLYRDNCGDTEETIAIAKVLDKALSGGG